MNHRHSRPSHLTPDSWKPNPQEEDAGLEEIPVWSGSAETRRMIVLSAYYLPQSDFVCKTPHPEDGRFIYQAVRWGSLDGELPEWHTFGDQMYTDLENAIHGTRYFLQTTPLKIAPFPPPFIPPYKPRML